MKKLINGIIDFRKNSLASYREKFAKLALEQKPDALFIACCDSRVVPNTFASSDPGDLFVVRNIGNLIPPYPADASLDHCDGGSTPAAIEFALLVLQVKNIIICGHSECGAMHTFTDGIANDLIFLNSWLKHAAPSYQRLQSAKSFGSHLPSHDQLSQINVLQQLQHLQTYPWVAERLANKQLGIHGWWFDLATADVYNHDANNDKFVLIDESYAKKIADSE